MSEPFFPPPKHEGTSEPEPGYRSAAARAADEAAPAPVKPVVVQRAEAPPESIAPAVKGKAPKLSKEEVQALLATAGALEKPSTAVVLGKRTWILVPVGLVSHFFGLVFGEHAAVAQLVTYGVGLVLAALYILAPLRKQEREGWH